LAIPSAALRLAAATCRTPAAILVADRRAGDTHPPPGPPGGRIRTPLASHPAPPLIEEDRDQDEEADDDL